jgi:hypothetical protein
MTAVGCDSDEKYGEVPPTTSASPSVSPSPTASPTPTLDPARQQVVDRYQLYVRTLERLYATTDTANVPMADVATGAQFRNDVETAIRLKGQNRRLIGSFDNAVSFQNFTVPGREAVVVNCQGRGTTQLVDATSGKPVGTPSPGPRLSQRVTMRVAEGSWKAAATTIGGECS